MEKIPITPGKALVGTSLIGGTMVTPPSVLAVQRANEIRSLNEDQKSWRSEKTTMEQEKKTWQKTKSDLDVNVIELKAKEKQFKNLLSFLKSNAEDDKKITDWAKSNMENIQKLHDCLGVVNEQKQSNNCMSEITAFAQLVKP